MPLSVQEKAEIIKKRAVNEGDTGSPEVQVALISARLEYLQKHFGIHVKDQHSRLGLMKLVGRRRRLLDYLKDKDVQKYRDLIQDLGIRK